MDKLALTGYAGAGDLKITAVINPTNEPLASGYRLSPEQAAFFKSETGIDDDDELRTHVLYVQGKAYKIFPYTCIKQFMFLRPGIETQPAYRNIIKLGQERADGILLDVGCCFGVDARKAVADGFPLKNVVTTDLMKDFFHIGHALFNTTPETYPINFVAGDVFDSAMLQIVPHFDMPPSTQKPDLSALTSLNLLAGRCAVVYASNFFHLFSEENQLRLAKALAGLLSPQPGSMICGEHAGNWEKGVFHGEFEGRVIDMFLHCPETWNAVWDGEVFVKGRVGVEAKLSEVELRPGLTFHQLQWSVTKL